ncbi:MAG: hypothetical protein VKL39_02145 [Leptolyngbyaceae bacterium]|nr:hypothetical protein [Leptolyngbyaceae bacterium]
MSYPTNYSESLSRFIGYCQTCQPYSNALIQRFFEGVVCFPYDHELLLQAYLYLNICQIFEHCDRLLLFEKPPYGDYTNVGKCDFVYLTKAQTILLIETKYIDTTASGDTERKRRNKHRNKVINQVQTLTQTFCDHWEFQPEQIERAVFTTDPSIEQRSDRVNIISRYVSVEDLQHWQRNFDC